MEFLISFVETQVIRNQTVEATAKMFRLTLNSASVVEQKSGMVEVRSRQFPGQSLVLQVKKQEKKRTKQYIALAVTDNFRSLFQLFYL